MKKYEVIGLIGNERNGRIYKIIRKSDKEMLLWKELRLELITGNEKRLIENEINILRELNHPNIVKQCETFMDDTGLKLNIVMEYCEKGDLDKLILQNKNNKNIIDEQLIWDILIQALNALNYMHNEKKILHNDIKPRNIFLDKNYNIKLGNFRLSQKYLNVYGNCIIGTIPYMSPELLEKKQSTFKADIWALGCSIYELATFVSPFDAPNMDIVLRKIKKGAPKITNNIYSEYLWNIISKMLIYDYIKRPSSSELLEECNAIISLRNNIFNIKNRNEVQAKWDKLIVYDIALQMKQKEQKEQEEKDKIYNKKDRELKEREQKILEKEMLVNEAYKEMLAKHKLNETNKMLNLNAFNNKNDIKNKEKDDDNFNLNKMVIIIITII